MPLAAPCCMAAPTPLSRRLYLVSAYSPPPPSLPTPKCRYARLAESSGPTGRSPLDCLPAPFSPLIPHPPLRVTLHLLLWIPAHPSALSSSTTRCQSPPNPLANDEQHSVLHPFQCLQAPPSLPSAPLSVPSGSSLTPLFPSAPLTCSGCLPRVPMSTR